MLLAQLSETSEKLRHSREDLRTLTGGLKLDNRRLPERHAEPRELPRQMKTVPGQTESENFECSHIAWALLAA